MITVVKDMDLLHDTWGQGRKNAWQLSRWGLLDEAEEIIKEWTNGYYEITDTTINDILWFDIDDLAQSLGYSDYEDMYRKLEEDEEEE